MTDILPKASGSLPDAHKRRGGPRTPPSPMTRHDRERLPNDSQEPQVQPPLANAAHPIETHTEHPRDRFHELFDDAPVGYITVRANGLIREANRTFARMLRMQAGDLRNVPFTRLMDADDQEVFYLYRANVLGSPSTRHCEVRLVAADGRRVWVQLVSTVSQSHDPSQREWRIVVTDVTERKQAQGELHRQRDLLEAVFDSAPAMIATIDLVGAVQLANPRWEAALGWTLRELQAERMWSRLFPNRPARNAAREFVREATGRWEEFRVATRFGDVLDLRCAVAPLFGNLRLIMALDVSQQRQAEESIHEHRESLRRVAGLNTISAMAAAISHEVNQPLTALINYATGAAYRLRALPGVPRDALEAVEHTIIEAHRTANIVRHIRALVAKRHIEQTPLDLNAVVENLTRLLSTETARANVALHVACQPDLPAIPADRVQVEQVIVNLVQNAIDAMEGTLDRLREVIVCTRLTEGPAILVSVIDRGHGLSPEVKQNLFTPFFTTKPYGTGIGLSLCLSIVEAHGGRLWADHNPEGGAIFRFTLPLPREARPSGTGHLPVVQRDDVVQPLAKDNEGATAPEP